MNRFFVLHQSMRKGEGGYRVKAEDRPEPIHDVLKGKLKKEGCALTIEKNRDPAIRCIPDRTRRDMSLLSVVE